MTYLWSGMIFVGVIYGTVTGHLQEVTEAAVSSSKEAVSLCVSMMGITAMWSGIMKIAEMTGLVEQLSRKMRPFLRFLFPGLDPESKACKYISLNFLSNCLGLGWAATPAGLKAMGELAKLEERRRDNEFRAEEKQSSAEGKRYGSSQIPAEEKQGRRRGKTMPRGTASNEMCTFLIINVSSLQLIPINIIAYRSQYGSVNPAFIAGPAILATFISTLAGIIFCRIMNRKAETS